MNRNEQQALREAEIEVGRLQGIIKMAELECRSQSMEASKRTRAALLQVAKILRKGRPKVDNGSFFGWHE